MSVYWLEIIILIAGVAFLLVEAFLAPERKYRVACFALFPLIIVLLLSFWAQAPNAANDEMARFYAWDGMARFFKVFVVLAAILTLVLALDYRKVAARFTANPGSEDGTGEYYCLLLFATAGMMWMASAKDLVSIFVALELTTITSYILVGYYRRNIGSLEAGVKFLILGALSTGFLVYGISWIYGATGTTDLALMSERITVENRGYLLFGLALILIALGFKVGAVPMQQWIPDVYQGAPTPTTAFLSIGSKAAGFAVLIRVVEPFITHPILQEPVTMILVVLAAATILVGNAAAIPQQNFKRLMAYSSIANAGFLLLPLAAWNGAGELLAWQVIAFYLFAYLLMTFAAFFILSIVYLNSGSEEIDQFEGLSERHPHLALMTATIMGALAGLPLTVGFWGKFLAFQSAIEAGLWIPLVIGFVGVAAGFYYYFKVIRAMYWRKSLNENPLQIRPMSYYTVVTLTALVVILGVWPKPIEWLIGG